MFACSRRSVFCQYRSVTRSFTPTSKQSVHKLSTIRRSVHQQSNESKQPAWAKHQSMWTHVSQSVIRITGKDITKFLNGLCTINLVELEKQATAQATISPSDISASQSNNQPVKAGYTVFLNPKGRFLFEAFIIPTSTAHYLIVPSTNPQPNTSTSQSESQSDDQSSTQSNNPSISELAVQHLSKYNIRNRAKIETIPAVHIVSITSDNRSSIQPISGFQFVDPRTPALGLRSVLLEHPITQLTSESIEQSALQLVETSQYVPGLAYDLLRILHCVPSSALILDQPLDQSINQSNIKSLSDPSINSSINQSVELITGKSLPLECNLDTVNAVSFSKGCYLGQEIIARHKYVGVLRKRLYTVILEPISQSNIEPNSQSKLIKEDELFGSASANNQSATQTVVQPFDSSLIDWTFPSTEVGPIAVTSHKTNTQSNEQPSEQVNDQSTPCGFIYSMHFNAAIAQLRCEMVENDCELRCVIRDQAHRVRVVDRPLLE